MTHVPLSQALPVYLRIGLLSFGGPAGQIALMHEELVTRRGWVAAPAFQRGLNVAMLLPGPEAQQLATRKRNGTLWRITLYCRDQTRMTLG